MRRVVWSALLAALLTLLSGCSSTTLVYNRLDFIIPWYVGKYVDLSRDQKQFLRTRLAPFLHWHRHQELPGYLAIIDDIEVALAEDITARQVAAVAGEAEAAWVRIEFRALDWLLALGETLSGEQMQEFVASLWEKQQDYEEKYLTRSDEEYREQVVEKLEDAARDFLGRLDRLQRSSLKEAVTQLQRSDAIWLEERARWLQRMEQLLQRETGWQEALREALRNREQTTSAAYRSVYEHNTQVIYRALAKLANSRSEKQDRRLDKRLEDLREDIESLIARGA